MKKAMEKVLDIRTEPVRKKRWQERKWLRKDIAMLAVLTIGVQSFSAAEHLGTGYIQEMACAGKYSTCLEGLCTKDLGNVVAGWKDKSIVTARDLINAGKEKMETEPERSVKAEQSAEPIQQVETPAVVEEKQVSEAAESALVGTKVESEITDEANETIEETVEETVEEPELVHLDGFLMNEKGMIVSCENLENIALDGIIILPTDVRCTGIEAGALDGITGAQEIYIPANITSIAPEILGKLEKLMYIEVASGNPVYESRDGALYSRTGELLAEPGGQQIQ